MDTQYGYGKGFMRLKILQLEDRIVLDAAAVEAVDHVDAAAAEVADATQDVSSNDNHDVNLLMISCQCQFEGNLQKY